MATQTTLEPYGKLISGRKGVSATRLAEALGVGVSTIRRIAEPIGEMWVYHPGSKPFPVYDPSLAETLNDHPEIEKARKRRASRSWEKAIATRKQRCVDFLCEGREDLRPLYQDLVEKAWTVNDTGLRSEEVRELVTFLAEVAPPGSERGIASFVVYLLEKPQPDMYSVPEYWRDLGDVQVDLKVYVALGNWATALVAYVVRQIVTTNTFQHMFSRSYEDGSYEDGACGSREERALYWALRELGYDRVSAVRAVDSQDEDALTAARWQVMLGS